MAAESGHEMHGLGLMRLHQGCKANELRDRWQCIVTDYSARCMTVPSDKLPALAGLARAFAQARGGGNDEYLAGLWRGSLLDDLL